MFQIIIYLNIGEFYEVVIMAWKLQKKNKLFSRRENSVRFCDNCQGSIIFINIIFIEFYENKKISEGLIKTWRLEESKEYNRLWI